MTWIVECGCGAAFQGVGVTPRFCPMCGAKMARNGPPSKPAEPLWKSEVLRQAEAVLREARR